MAANTRPRDEVELKIVILGPDGAGKSSVIQGLISCLNQGERTVKMRHLKPRLVNLRPGEVATIVVDPHGKPARSALTSLAKILAWLLEEWYAFSLQDERNTLLICDRYYHDLLVDPKRYRYGGPLWAAKLIGMLMPRPKLWVLLDAPVAVLQARKQEVSQEETSRQRDAYLAFVRNQRNFVIVDASQTLVKVITDVERAITKTIAQGESIRG